MATNMASASRKHSNNLVNLANPQPADRPGRADKEDTVVDRQVMADKAAHKAGAMAKILLPRPSEADADRR